MYRHLSTATPSSAGVWRAAACAALALTLGGCLHKEKKAEAEIPFDYRLRHPISIQEKERTLEVFVGSARGGLTPAQRADVLAFIGTWRREATGGMIADVPAGTPNARAAADAFREMRSILTGAGVPSRAVVTRSYRPSDPTQFATIRLTYPKIAATAGPCGLWPEDLGPTKGNPIYLENRPYWNLGCATQRNLAAMVENPADLVQPRAEMPAYTSRRATMFEKYRKGEPTAQTYPEADRGRISDLGK